MVRPLWVLGLLVCLLAGTGCSTLISATREGPITLHPGKRTFGTIINDQQLETVAKVNLNKAHPELQHAHISVVSFNGVVLLTGQVKSAELRQLAGDTVAKIQKVRQVYNELQIQGKTSFLARTNDTWLTTKVKTRMMMDKDVDSGRVKVVTEDGTIFLMGLLSRVEADRAAQIARSTGGVQKVVKAVEYLN